MGISYAIRKARYRGEDGYHIGSRGGGGFPVSIFTPVESSANVIRNAYRDFESGKITATVRDEIVDRELLRGTKYARD